MLPSKSSRVGRADCNPRRGSQQQQRRYPRSCADGGGTGSRCCDTHSDLGLPFVVMILAYLPRSGLTVPVSCMTVPSRVCGHGLPPNATLCLDAFHLVKSVTKRLTRCVGRPGTRLAGRGWAPAGDLKGAR